jgi:uncharacterized cupin superfamily protein
MPNVFSAEFEYDPEDPVGYRCGAALVGQQAGASATNVKLYEMPRGESLCPYHYEFEEEWLLLLSGELILRTPLGERPLSAGELVCFPAGPAGAHKVTNRAQEPARVMMFSSAREPAVCVYPDSAKVGVFTPHAADRFMFSRRNGNEPYYADEV